jgi:hypothetical protein
MSARRGLGAVFDEHVAREFEAKDIDVPDVDVPAGAPELAVGHWPTAWLKPSARFRPFPWPGQDSNLGATDYESAALPLSYRAARAQSGPRGATLALRSGTL